MVTSADWTIINAIRLNNEARTVHSREWVGVLYFLIGTTMIEICVAVALLQNYVLPWRRFAFIYANLGNHKVGTALHFVINVSLYFLISGSAGMSGFVVTSCFLGLWSIVLGIVAAIRRCLAPGDGTRRSSTTTGLSPKAAAELHAGSTSPRRMSELAPKGMMRLTPTQEALGLDADRADVNLLWRACPAPLAPGQAACALSSLIMLVVLSGIVIAVLFGWDIPDYHIVRGDTTEVEFQPALNAKSLQFMYAFPGFATQFQLQLYVKLFTEYCGKSFTKATSNKRTDIYNSWISEYSINMTIFVPSDYNSYASVDEWFTRAIDPQFRPLPDNAHAVVSPADCRLLVFNSEGDSLFWLKGYPVVYNKLLGGVTVAGLANYFDNGQLMIARLAPQDYHRFHSPVSGTVVQMLTLSGTYWSVSSDAARSGNDAFLNLRKVLIIDAGPQLGYVAYVGVGATCVGSVRFDVEPIVTVGSIIERGQVLGSMHFGGSTVLVLFSPGRVVFDPLLIQRSLFGVETGVNVNSQVGTIR